MKRKNHIQVAIEALKKQYAKYESERDKSSMAETAAKHAVEYFEAEMDKLAEQIASLEGVDEKEPIEQKD